MLQEAPVRRDFELERSGVTLPRVGAMAREKLARYRSTRTLDGVTTQAGLALIVDGEWKPGSLYGSACNPHGRSSRPTSSRPTSTRPALIAHFGRCASNE